MSKFSVKEIKRGSLTVVISDGGVSVSDGHGDFMCKVKHPKDVSKAKKAELKKIADMALKEYGIFFKTA